MSATSAGMLGHDQQIEVVITSHARRTPTRSAVSTETTPRQPTPVRPVGLAEDAGLAALVDRVARRDEAAADSLRALYDLTAAELSSTVRPWTTASVAVDDVVVATYVQVWDRAPTRPAGLPVPKWLAGLALAQVRSLSDAAERSSRPRR